MGYLGTSSNRVYHPNGKPYIMGNITMNDESMDYLWQHHFHTDPNRLKRRTWAVGWFWPWATWVKKGSLTQCRKMIPLNPLFLLEIQYETINGCVSPTFNFPKKWPSMNRCNGFAVVVHPFIGRASNQSFQGVWESGRCVLQSFFPSRFFVAIPEA